MYLTYWIHNTEKNTINYILEKFQQQQQKQSFLGAFKGLTLSSLEKSLIQNTTSPKMSNERGPVGISSNCISITCYKISESLLW